MELTSASSADPAVKLPYGGDVHQSRSDADSPRPGRRLGVMARAGSLLLAVLLLLIALTSLVLSLRIGYVGFSRHDMPNIVREQLNQLEVETVRDAPDRNRRALPENSLTQLVMTGLATAADDTRPAIQRLPMMRTYLRRIDDPAIRDRFVSTEAPEGGALYAGAALLISTEVARLSTEEGDRADVRRRALPLLRSLTQAPSGLLPNHEGRFRPAETILVAGALRRADDLVDVPGVSAAIREWVSRIEPLRDPGNKLFPHETRADGNSIEGPRATSQAVIQVFWPSLDPVTSSRDWVAFENTFLCPRLGLAAVCEFAGGHGVGDEISGPLVFGVSPQATALTMAAARAHGNTALAEQISREAELFGLPLVEEGQRRYLAGVWPHFDALLACSRSAPVGKELPGVDDRGPVQWMAWALCALIPGVLASGALAWRVMGRRRRLSGPLEGDAAPPDAP